LSATAVGAGDVVNNLLLVRSYSKRINDFTIDFDCWFKVYILVWVHCFFLLYGLCKI
jgi:hypothetical protein